METTKPAFDRIRFRSWKAAYSFADELNDSARFFFRGQADASWLLRSSLERAIGVCRGDTLRWDNSEKRMLRKVAADNESHNQPSR